MPLSDLPIEIYINIFSFLASSRSTLISLILVSKDFAAEARRTLYTNLRFSDSARSTSACARLLRRLPTHPCSPLVRSLEIERLEAHRISVDRLNAALRALHGLKIFQTSYLDPSNGFTITEVMKGVDFTLERFSIDNTISKPEMALLSSSFGRKITELEVRDIKAPPSEYTLPWLQTLCVSSLTGEALELINKCRVRRVCVYLVSLPASTIDPFYDLSSIVSLSFQANSAPLDLVFCPSLRFLHVNNARSEVSLSETHHSPNERPVLTILNRTVWLWGV